MDTLDYLYGLQRFGIKLGLDIMNQLMQILDNPHKKFRSIHIAGTNGKGSVAAMIASILQKSGLKVGLYTSPHLVKFNERITINGIEITDKELVNYTELIRKKLGDLQPTFFEFTTALAFLYFAQRKVEIAVVEVGLGGRLDATNVLRPDIAVITNIGLDHTEHLGSTIDQIAAEKAGILKDCPLITGAQGDALDVIRIKANKLVVVDEVLSEDLDNGQEFSLQGGQYFIPLLGKHQVRNACIAVSVAKELKIPNEDVIEGLRDVNWPGRLEYLYDNMLIDCAHNLDGMKTLVEYVKDLSDRKVLLLGVSEDKNSEEMVKLIAPFFERVIATEGNYKPLEVNRLAGIIKKYNSKVVAVKDVKLALRMAIDAVRDGKLLLVTGSIYVVGDVLGLMRAR